MTDDSFVPFASPDISESEIAEVVDTLRSGWLTSGPKTARFESSFVDFIRDGMEFPIHAVAVNSATAGLHLALEAAGVKPGDEVITSVHTFTATAEVVRYLGAHPRFVDIDADTLNLSVSETERAITPRTRCILPVHFAGLPCDLRSIIDIASRHQLSVVEDAAHALPSRLDGTLIGAHGTAATVFSFYANKPVSTGEGGMIITHDAALAARCRVMRSHGIDRDASERYRSRKAAWYYQVIEAGYKYNLTDIASSLGIHQLRRQPAMHARRAEIARRYSDAFAQLPVILPAGPLPGDVHSWHLYVIRIMPNAKLRRDEFIDRLFELGVGTSVHYIPLHQHPYWREAYGLRADSYPNSTAAAERSVSLPISSGMTDPQVARVIECVRATLS